MNTTLRLYIGSNNQTHKVERDLLVRTLAKYHSGFTIQPALGYWEGASEDSVTVVIADEYSTIIDTVHRLKQVLKQDAIAVQRVEPLEFL